MYAPDSNWKEVSRVKEIKVHSIERSGRKEQYLIGYFAKMVNSADGFYRKAGGVNQ
jgi:hypothetical protein